MVVVPMNNRWKGHPIQQFLHRARDGKGTQTHTFGRTTQIEHGSTFFGDTTFISKKLQGIVFTKVFGNHFQASGTAVHHIELPLVGEGF